MRNRFVRYITGRPTLWEYTIIRILCGLAIVLLLLQPDGPIAHRWPLLASAVAIWIGMALARKFLHD